MAPTDATSPSSPQAFSVKPGDTGAKPGGQSAGGAPPPGLPVGARKVPEQLGTQKLQMGVWPSEPVGPAPITAPEGPEQEPYFERKSFSPPKSSQPEEDWPTLDPASPHPPPLLHPADPAYPLLASMPSAGANILPALLPFPTVLPIDSPPSPLAPMLPALTELRNDQLSQIAFQLRSQLRPETSDQHSQTFWATKDVGVSAGPSVRDGDCQTALSSTREPLAPVMALKPPTWEEEGDEEGEGEGVRKSCLFNWVYQSMKAHSPWSVACPGDLKGVGRNLSH